VSVNFSRAACAGFGVPMSVGHQAGRFSYPADEMTASKVCVACTKKAVYGKQNILRYNVSCSSGFHQTCLRVSDNEYCTYSANWESTYQCDSCRKKPGVGRRDDIPRRSTPKDHYKSDIFFRNNLDVELHAHLESIRTNG